MHRVILNVKTSSLEVFPLFLLATLIDQPSEAVIRTPTAASTDSTESMENPYNRRKNLRLEISSIKAYVATYRPICLRFFLADKVSGIHILGTILCQLVIAETVYCVPFLLRYFCFCVFGLFLQITPLLLRSAGKSHFSGQPFVSCYIVIVYKNDTCFFII